MQMQKRIPTKRNMIMGYVKILKLDLLGCQHWQGQFRVVLRDLVILFNLWDKASMLLVSGHPFCYSWIQYVSVRLVDIKWDRKEITSPENSKNWVWCFATRKIMKWSNFIGSSSHKMPENCSALYVSKMRRVLPNWIVSFMQQIIWFWSLCHLVINKSVILFIILLLIWSNMMEQRNQSKKKMIIMFKTHLHHRSWCRVFWRAYLRVPISGP